MTDLQPVDGLFERAGWAMPPIPEVAHVVAYGQSLASVQSLPGVRVEADTTPSGIDARITISSGRVVLEPIHLCLGLFDAFDVQDVRLVVTLEPFARSTLWAHGLSSAPGEARHSMDAEIHVMQGAVLDHQEAHFHGDTGAIQVTPRARVHLGQGACYRADFSLLHGRVGRLDVDYRVTVGEAALAELTSRVYGMADDAIRLSQRLDLDGTGARGLVKTRVAVRDDAVAEVIGAVEGNAAGARGPREVVDDGDVFGIGYSDRSSTGPRRIE